MEPFLRMLAVVAALLAASLSLPGGPRAQAPLPRPPCAAGETPFPAYALVDAPAAVATWRALVFPDKVTGEAASAASCFGRLQGPMAVTVAIAGTFRHGGGLDGLAARIGAVSRTSGLLYWSTGEQKWRRLVSEAWALTGPDVAARRQDFEAAEIRRPGTRYFAQNDTRSTGANLYSLRTLQSAPDRLVIEIVNESPIGFSVVRLFDGAGLLSLVFLDHLGGELWGYYGIMAVRDDVADGYEKSLVNRAAAFQRFLLEQPGDATPPLAK